MGLISAPFRFPALAALLILLPSGAIAQTLTWDPNTDPNVTGYRLFYGTESGKYTNQVDVGKATSYQPTDVDWKKPAFFAIQAYTSAGFTSSLSEEVQWTAPVVTPPAPTTARLTSLSPNATSPFLRGKPVTWTATAQGPAAIEYRFWMLRKGAWKLAQEYGANNTFTWTPTWADQGGPYQLQVWARTSGTTVEYESWLGTPEYEVASVPVEVSADVDFPTPPNNPVTWKLTVAESGTIALEYQFWLLDEAANTWTVLREYGPSNEAVWVPDKVGRFAVQAWARQVGSTKPFDLWTGRYADVARTNLEVTALSSDVALPATTGARVAWTARPRGGVAGPLEYQFWLYSQKKGWTVGQPYGPSKVFTWTPQWGDEGDNAVQVWVRNAGSSASYESWRGTALFKIAHSDMHLTTTSLLPLAPGSKVNWFAEAAPSPASFEYQFWVYQGSTASWAVGKAYGAGQTFTWTPATEDTYAIQAWARQSGSSAAYEKWRGTGFLQVFKTPARIRSLTSSVQLPVVVGTTIKWTTLASGGSGQLEYKFWRWTSAGWVMVQDYSPSTSYTWTPGSADVGQHALQVWVRSAGSKAQYEAYMGTGVFAVKQ